MRRAASLGQLGLLGDFSRGRRIAKTGTSGVFVWASSSFWEVLPRAACRVRASEGVTGSITNEAMRRAIRLGQLGLLGKFPRVAHCTYRHVRRFVWASSGFWEATPAGGVSH